MDRPVRPALEEKLQNDLNLNDNSESESNEEKEDNERYFKNFQESFLKEVRLYEINKVEKEEKDRRDFERKRTEKEE